MSTTINKSTDKKLKYISEEIHEYFRDGYYYDVLPEKLKASLDKHALVLYDFQDHCDKSLKRLEKTLEKIIKRQYAFFSTVDYYWMEDVIPDAVIEGFNEMILKSFSLCENIKDKQPLSKIYNHSDLWKSDGKQPHRRESLLKTLRRKVKTLTGSEWDQLIKENKVFELLHHENNEERRKPVYDAVKKVLVAAFPAMSAFDATAWAIYDAWFEKGYADFRIKLFLLELRLDCGISSRFFRNEADAVIQKFIKLPKSKRAAINKLAERRMRGEKV
jgi:hypothetical protein